MSRNVQKQKMNVYNFCFTEKQITRLTRARANFLLQKRFRASLANNRNNVDV